MRIDKGRLFVLSGPSGAGKSTVINRVIAGREDLQFSVSATTRAPRKGEVDGVNYHFTDRAHFGILRTQLIWKEEEEWLNCSRA